MIFIRSILLLMAFSASCLYPHAIDNNNNKSNYQNDDDYFCPHAEQLKQLFNDLYPQFKVHRKLIPNKDIINYEQFTAVLYQDKTTIKQANFDSLVRAIYNHSDSSTKGDSILHVAVRLASIDMIMHIKKLVPELCKVINNKGKIPHAVIRKGTEKDVRMLIENILNEPIDWAKVNRKREAFEKKQKDGLSYKSDT